MHYLTDWTNTYVVFPHDASCIHSVDFAILVIQKLSSNGQIVTDSSPWFLQPRQFVAGGRKCAPLLENVSEDLPSGPAEWKAVPDIWKTAAERYGDRVALVDPHRQPPAQITYKQLAQSILDFAEGLRVCGISPDQNVALLADNSYRWLIADQGRARRSHSSIITTWYDQGWNVNLYELLSENWTFFSSPESVQILNLHSFYIAACSSFELSHLFLQTSERGITFYLPILIRNGDLCNRNNGSWSHWCGERLQVIHRGIVSHYHTLW